MDKQKQEARALRNAIATHGDMVRSHHGGSYVIDKDGKKTVDPNATSTAPYAPTDEERAATARAQNAERDEFAAIQAEANARSAAPASASPSTQAADAAEVGTVAHKRVR